ncbi:MAG: UbiA family prenyltransferase [Euryarchaeota archaeon]|nr:UbiA family prenyltransferase [Euryarchaeota archaeon]
MLKVKAYLELSRWVNCLMAGLAVLLGGFISLVNYTEIFSVYLKNISLAIFVAIAISAAGNAINDYYDTDIDRINKSQKPIPSGRLTRKEALIFALVLFAHGVFLSLFINPRLGWAGKVCFFIALFNSVLLIAYSARLKRAGFSGNITIGYLVGSTFLFGGAAIGNLIAAGILALCAMLATISREIAKGIEDYVGDKACGAKTLPVLIGPAKASVIMLIFLVAAIALSPFPYLLRLFGYSYLVVVGIADLVFLVAIGLLLSNPTPARAAEVKRILKFGMGVALLAFLVGAVVK